MLAVVHNPKADPQRRDEMAKAAAPYIHPRIGLISATADATHSAGPITVTVVSVPHDHYLSADEIRLSMGLPPMEPTEPRLVVDNDANEGP
jgi:hypothetical protein